MEAHTTTVSHISHQIRAFHASHTPFHITHGGATNSTRPSSLSPANTVDTSALSHILSISSAERLLIAEPNVSMRQLVRACLAHHRADTGTGRPPFLLLPPVILEFPSITLGGAVSGTSGESSSFRHGFFDARERIAWVEVVLGDGRVVRASAEENAELFDGVRGGWGTVGVVTLVGVRLVEAVGEWVRVGYGRVEGWKGMVGGLEDVIGGEGDGEQADGGAKVDFVDGIMFSRTEGAVVTGSFVAAPSEGEKIQTFHKPWDPWFYLHAQKVISTLSLTETHTELVPLESYLFRYDRGAFWTGRHAYKYFLVPFTPLFRYLLDYFMHTRVMYHALHASGHMDRFIVQDCVLPACEVEEFVTGFVEPELGIWPLWLCPLRGPEGDGGRRSFHPYPRLSKGEEKEGQWPLNVGVWGPNPTGADEERCLRVNRALEKELRRLGGMKWLYAQIFCNEEEFWSLYDREAYDALREKWHASSLPSVWDKVKRKEKTIQKKGLKSWLWRVWPVSGLYGVCKAWGGGNYLVKKEGSDGWVWLGVLILGLVIGILALL